MEPHHSSRWPFALLVVGIAAFTVYGSLVPFEYRARPWDEVSDTFPRMMRERLLFESRSDALANVLLGIPLGFGLLGVIFANRGPNLQREMVLGLLLLPGCGLFAAAIEFVQLYFPLRTCAGSDVLCQIFGAALGMTAWVLWGRQIARCLQDFWSGNGSAQRSLCVYLALLTFIQVLPLDLNASPRTAAKKALREVNYVPFGEVIDAPHGQQWGHIAKLAKVFSLFVPVGLFASRLTGRFWVEMVFHRVLAVAGATALMLEAIQLPIESRMPSATDVVSGTAGIVAGWVFGWIDRPAFLGGNLLGYIPFWLIVLVIIWGPLPFPPVIRTPPAAFDWIPGLSLESGNPLFALEDMLTKLVVFGLGGAMIGALDANLTTRTRCLIGAGIGFTVSSGIEALQTVFGAHTPSITDVLLGGIGAGIGAMVAALQSPPIAMGAIVDARGGSRGQ